MPPDTYLVEYTDDVVAVVTGRDLEDVQRKLRQVMLRTKEWSQTNHRENGIGSDHWKTHTMEC